MPSFTSNRRDEQPAAGALFPVRDEGREFGDLAVGRLALEVAHKRDVARADFVEHRAAVLRVDVADLRRGTCDAELCIHIVTLMERPLWQ